MKDASGKQPICRCLVASAHLSLCDSPDVCTTLLYLGTADVPCCRDRNNCITAGYAEHGRTQARGRWSGPHDLLKWSKRLCACCCVRRAMLPAASLSQRWYAGRDRRSRRALPGNGRAIVIALDTDGRPSRKSGRPDSGRDWSGRGHAAPGAVIPSRFAPRKATSPPGLAPRGGPNAVDLADRPRPVAQAPGHPRSRHQSL